ncbi:hypothetical protein [Octadecabacter ascidiaceicola]|uniref:Uncharacterized protein n=1 Tax=Octadecabacter ascidiaceicola TaxID=1655543 RepID=A0A238KK85_9RHOB|nr:hypothetical protein [Octadecabacter ascidiaceicola]SMX42476.1 hypothetical protein OCA8868_02752 [Octadecabacter ascidiaceicola]
MKVLIRIAMLMAAAVMPMASQAETRIVKIETVTLANDQEQRIFCSRVVARETPDLAFQIGGQIIEMPIEEGAFMSAGVWLR